MKQDSEEIISRLEETEKEIENQQKNELEIKKERIRQNAFE
jgi:hypothetical protein